MNADKIACYMYFLGLQVKSRHACNVREVMHAAIGHVLRKPLVAFIYITQVMLHGRQHADDGWVTCSAFYE